MPYVPRFLRVHGLLLPQAEQQQPQQQQQQQQPRRQLRPSAQQTAAAAGVEKPPPLPAVLRGPAGVFEDDNSGGEAADAFATAAALEAEAAATASAAGGSFISDTLAALRLLHAQFPDAGRAAGLAPVMLKSQLYSIVADRTAVDRQLEDLR